MFFNLSHVLECCEPQPLLLICQCLCPRGQSLVKGISICQTVNISAFALQYSTEPPDDSIVEQRMPIAFNIFQKGFEPSVQPECFTFLVLVL